MDRQNLGGLCYLSASQDVPYNHLLLAVIDILQKHNEHHVSTKRSVIISTMLWFGS